MRQSGKRIYFSSVAHLLDDFAFAGFVFSDYSIAHRLAIILFGVLAKIALNLAQNFYTLVDVTFTCTGN